LHLIHSLRLLMLGDGDSLKGAKSLEGEPGLDNIGLRRKAVTLESAESGRPLRLQREAFARSSRREKSLRQAI
jgi:hypothetical protein